MDTNKREATTARQRYTNSADGFGDKRMMRLPNAFDLLACFPYPSAAMPITPIDFELKPLEFRCKQRTANGR